MAAELVGGALLSAFVDVLAGQLASEVVDFFRGKESIVMLVKELKIALSSADLLLDDAEEKLITKEKVKKWLDDLKETIYDADDLVYKINTEALRNELEGESQSGCAWKVLIMNLISTRFTAFDKEIKPEIEEILGKLKLLLENKELGLKPLEKQKLPERVCAPLVEESDVYGRDVDKEAVIEVLLSDSMNGDKLSVIPIVGMGGIGKTTLAQLVYNDKRVKEKFGTRAWITVGNDKVDCLKVMKTVFKKVTNSKDCEIEELCDLQIELKEVLKEKKFLFVLDDVWDEDPHKWDVLKSSFQSGLPGSKIVVTTRDTKVASIMKTGLIHYLKGVSHDHGWQLFAKHASIDVSSTEYLDLQGIGKRIVCKCKGLPLAIKSLGGLLRGTRNMEDWNNILKSDIWELYERDRIRILPALWFSYFYLPSHLKLCFAYCALLPKDYVFEKENIILLWMAEGLLHSTTKKKKRIEEVGEEYFQDLISRSFFQPSSEDESALIMHDLMHDLALFASGEFCLDMNDAKFSSCARKIRLLSYNGRDDNPGKFEGLSKVKGLRTFLTLPESKSGKKWSLEMKNLLETLVDKGHCLRVLSLSGCHITRLPDSIGDLKYLKYLNLSDTEIEKIPDTICNLYNLQTLLLEDCSEITHLPTNIGNLINLRHLRVPPFLKEMPLQIGKMENLQTLNKFFVSENRELGIKLLKELQDLHGTLQIWRLEKVVDIKDVWEAKLKKKEFLSELDLSWRLLYVPADLEKEKEVLGALEPHTNLKKLYICDYKGSSFPNWVGHHLYSYLVKVRLYDCNNCSLLPPLGQLPSLKQLEIWGFRGVVRISSEFYSSAGRTSKPFRYLESLHFKEMSNLQEWLFGEDNLEGGVFPRLKELRLLRCPRLKVTLPDYLPSLRKLIIDKCDQLAPLLPRAQQMDAAFPSLESLELFECRGQASLLEGGLPSSLKQIGLFYCNNLKALDEETFQRLNFLEKLQIFNCSNIQCLPRRLPASLSYLNINQCGSLIPRLQRETGEDWSTIANIESVDIFPDPNRVTRTTTRISR
ncbi:NB-ARC domain containing protein [Trema orientale]|uniref:NB-ARC domain containing protein n=1 Tax=Trema orientale TaxID=63057 RepID=A0A2P5A6B4_TREOI|nr:NB-ARC domain containing protein [Trema orientale]